MIGPPPAARAAVLPANGVNRVQAEKKRSRPGKAERAAAKAAAEDAAFVTAMTEAFARQRKIVAIVNGFVTGVPHTKGPATTANQILRQRP